MKIKLLATLASVLLAGSMLAQNLSVSEDVSRLEHTNPTRFIQLSTSPVKHRTPTSTVGKMTAVANTTINSMQKVAELDGSPVKTLANGDVYTIEGKYIIYINDCYDENGAFDTSLNATIVYDSSAGHYWIKEESDGYNWFTSDVPFNFSNNTLTFFENNIGAQRDGRDTYYVKFTPFVYSYRPAGIYSQSTMSVPFDPSTGVFSFQSDTGFAWEAYSTSTYSEDDFVAFWQIFDVYRGAHEPMAAETWNNVGTAVFMDGWLLPGYSVDQKDIENWYEVPVEQSSNNPNKYRLVNPYKYGILATTGTNTSKSTGYIVFDVSDPDHVLFDTNTEAGYTDIPSNIRSLYCYDILSWAMASLNASAEEAMGRLLQPVPFTTYRYGVVDLNSVVRDGNLVYAAVFGDHTGNLAGKSWVGCDMTGRIILPDGVGLGFINNTSRVSNISDKTAIVSFDFKSYHLTSAHKVYVNFSDGKGYSKRVQVSGTHADAELTDLQPLTSYTMTITLEAKSGNSTVATSFPTTVTFTTLEEIVLPDPEIDAPAFVMVAPYETVDLTSYFSEVEVAAWTTADEDIAAVEAGKVIGQNYGETTVTATRPKGGEWASIKVLVCPSLTVLYPEGVETTHLVGYGSPIDVKLGANDGWRVCTASVDGRDITDQVETNAGWLLSNMAVTHDTTVNIVTAKTTNPSWADTIRIIVDGRDVSITGADTQDNVVITNYKDEKTVYDWNVKEIPFQEGGVFNVKITKNGSGEAYFRIVINN